MLFWPLEGEILSLFATFLAFCDFVSIIICNFGTYFSKESTKTYLLKSSSESAPRKTSIKGKTNLHLERTHKRRLHP